MAAEVADGGDECAVGEKLVAAEGAGGRKGGVGGAGAEVDVEAVPPVPEAGEAVGGEGAVEVDREPGAVVEGGGGEGGVVAGVEEPVVIEGTWSPRAVASRTGCCAGGAATACGCGAMPCAPAKVWARENRTRSRTHRGDGRGIQVWRRVYANVEPLPRRGSQQSRTTLTHLPRRLTSNRGAGGDLPEHPVQERKHFSR